MSETTIEQTPLCECGCGGNVTPGLVFGKPRRYIRGHGPQAQGKTKTARKPGRTPSLDELKGSTPERDEDRAPGTGDGKSKRRRHKTAAQPEEVPYRAGVIARGMNKLYARTGKFVRVMDADIGSAIIAATRKEAKDDVTVGEAWDELAKTNPRIRSILMKMITGGAWSQVIMAHLPILLAVLMKDAIRKRLPFPKLVDMAAAFGSDEDTGDEEDMPQPGGMAAMLAQLTPADVEQIGAMMNGMMGGIVRNVGGTGRVPETEAADGEG